ncbi:hypothetical protein CYMTET_54103 [Cymbomonas tetramitiformis]|uniref:Nucleotide-diphospho-sugar transferase domain-containing protein n=1 Tax=Cymbomonas tetramitiformis TaxID=36881 RepID=A0AAE0BFZ7_9CHLO|nr:hypothetical protein CYMTET_54103 [Cymbomonas tetramitiformis]KAK3235715.1 hypothetical protein CYMTET_54103 [Cymbomonas tetramitiformis]
MSLLRKDLHKVEQILGGFAARSPQDESRPSLLTEFLNEVDDLRVLNANVSHGDAGVGASREQTATSSPPPAPPPKIVGPSEYTVAKPFTGAVREADYALNRALVQRNLCPRNTIIITWATFDQYQFALNWDAHMRSIQLGCYLVLALDKELLEQLILENIPACIMPRMLPTAAVRRAREAQYEKGVAHEVNIAHLMMRLGVTVLLSHVDAVWLRNPMPFFAAYPEADILTSSDSRRATHGMKQAERLEDPRRVQGSFNIGVLLLRPSAARFVTEWYNSVHREASPRGRADHQQKMFYELLRRGVRSGEGTLRGCTTVRAYDRTLALGILPVSVFGNGHTFFVQNLSHRLHAHPYVVHATYQFGGSLARRHRMRDGLLWKDPAAYYRHPGGYITFDPHIPQSYLHRRVGVELHIALVKHQLQQLRGALAVAQVLGRALVLPPLRCAADRWWSPHDGRLPGTDFPRFVPFVCPMDHVLDVAAWLKPRDEHRYGPHIEFRAASFLSHPQLPSATRTSRVKIAVCGSSTRGGSRGCPAKATDLGQVAVAKGLTDKQLQTALEPHAAVKILDFSSMVGFFGGFEDHETDVKFRRRIQEYASEWCCKYATPGHIPFDFFWDEVRTTRITTGARTGQQINVARK